MGRHRTLRELIAELRLTPEEAREGARRGVHGGAVRLRALRVRGLGEREEAELEAERRRWAHPSQPVEQQRRRVLDRP
jgi:hypothetical protein